MNTKRKQTIFSAALIGVLALTSADASDNLKAFPPAEEGMTRCVINLPEQEEAAQ